jgi:hypothetical protein
MKLDVDNYTIEYLAQSALEKPKDFGYWGSVDMFNTWGFTGIDQTRDSNILDRSNFRVISNDLMKMYPNDFEIESYSHWACGSIDRLVCRILKSPGDIIEENITLCFFQAMEWHRTLEQYPVADDDDYLDLIREECLDYIENMADYLLLVTNTKDDGWAAKILDTLENELDFIFSPDQDQYPDDDQVLEAILKSELCNPERWGEWYEWCDEHGFDRPIFPVKENPNQLKLFQD